MNLFPQTPFLFRNRVKRIAKALSTSTLNQVVSSGTNFAMGLYLVRALGPAEFGIYGIGIAISLFYSGIGNALFLTQMVVHTPDKVIEDRRPYAARMLTALLLFCLLTVVFALVAFIAGGPWSAWLAKYSGLGLPIAAASVAYLLKDFFVRHSYTARKEIWALVVNIAVAFTLVVLLLLQYLSPDKFTSERALWFYSVSNLSGAVIGYFFAKLPLRGVRLCRMVEDAQEAWRGGRWAIGGVSVTWMQSQAYTYVAAIFLGPAGVGYANAARMLITPFSMLVPAINQVTMPRLADLRLHDRKKMIRTGFFITSGLLVAAVVYAATIIASADRLVPFILGDRFQNLRPIIITWSIVLLLQLLRDGAGTIIQVMKNFRVLMLANTLSAVATVVSAVVLMKLYGVPGAILGTGIGELLLALMLWRFIWNERKNIN